MQICGLLVGDLCMQIHICLLPTGKHCVLTLCGYLGIGLYSIDVLKLICTPIADQTSCETHQTY